MASKLTTLAQQRGQLGYQRFSADSVRWLSRKTDELRGGARMANSIAKEGNRAQGGMVGKLYFFYYDPKLANKLPYYDTFPLVIILEKYTDGFLGLNLHYLPVMLRASFMDMLMDYAEDSPRNDQERLRVTYNILKNTRSLKAFKPCIKRYLVTNMGSRPLLVTPDEWEVACFLPVEQFRKKPATVVQEESVRKIT